MLWFMAESIGPSVGKQPQSNVSTSVIDCGDDGICVLISISLPGGNCGFLWVVGDQMLILLRWKSVDNVLFLFIYLDFFF